VVQTGDSSPVQEVHELMVIPSVVHCLASSWEPAMGLPMIRGAMRASAAASLMREDGAIDDGVGGVESFEG
jgi:hypothetical protein